MEVERPSIPLPHQMLHSEDHLRLPRGARSDDYDKPRVSSEDTRINGDSGYTSAALSALDDSPQRTGNETTDPLAPRPEEALLTLDETTQLFRRKVQDARQDTDHALEGGQAVDESVKPKLTLDLGHANIARLPEGVVDLIKAEVERLSLSHNQIWHIPLRFTECLHLRYLNIRSNVFREIPRGVYKLPLLEILDISRNKVRRIPKEIRSLTSLRVLSIVHNRVDDLPPELCDMTKLQILKIAENPLRFKLKKVVEAKEAEVAFSEMTDNERETAVTAEIKRYLRKLYPIVTAIDNDSGGEFSEGHAETPRPIRRVVSSRFPVIPTKGSSEMISDFASRSPGQGRPPPLPTRSHYRIASGQNMVGIRRPGVAPLVNGNERSRSNSESVLQASAAARNKRMGILKKEKPELETVEESKSNRHSHLRGFSHGSVLRTRNGGMPSPGAPNSASPNSPRDNRRQRTAFVKRLSSLPEHKKDGDFKSPVIEGAKGILYALYQVHPQISGLIAATKGRDARRNSLEFTFYNASTHVDRLNEALESADALREEDQDAIDKAEDNVERDCATCVMAYTHVAVQLQDSVRRIVAATDARYVRTLMLLLYGSIVEIKNAIGSFGIDIETDKRPPANNLNGHIQTIPEEFSTPQQPVRTATPTRDRMLSMNRPGLRLRSETTIQHPILEDAIAYPPNPPFAQDQFSHPPTQPPTPLTGSTLHGGSYHNSVTSFASNGSTLHSTIKSSAALRSRSNSRNFNALAQNPSIASSLAGTPRSGDAFHLPPPSTFSSRINPATGLTDAQEESVFEQIFLALTRAYDSALQMIPIAKGHFLRCLEAAEENRQPKQVRELWNVLIWRCRSCLDASETLKSRLVNMRLKDPVVTINGAGSGRNDPAFWQLCRSFIQVFVDLVTDMKEAKDLRLLSQELVIVLRPVQKASREAGRLIETGPWGYLADSIAGAVQPPGTFGGSNGYVNGINGVNAYTSALQQHQQHHQQQPSLHRAPFPPPVTSVPPVPSSVAAAANGTSPSTVPLPATPLSAALGPAAQATIPSTPASAYGNEFFAGNVFQRADSLLNMPQAGNMNFLNRR